MSPFWRNLVLIVVAAIVLLGALSYVLMNAGGSKPERGKGDPISGVATPERR